MNSKFNAFPPILKGQAGFNEVLNSARDRIGIDLEFSPTTGKPTILGIASQTLAYGGAWSDDHCRTVLDSGLKLSAYSGLGADKPIIEARLGIETSLDRWDDGMLKHYLCNANMAGGGALEEGADDTSALGLMNLWTASSLATKLPNWKRCMSGGSWNDRSKPDCGNICPVHNETEYCAIDAYAGLLVDDYYDKEMERKKIPVALYERLKRLSVYCDKMQKHGVKIDRKLVAELEKQIKDKKFGLFPFEIKHKIGKKGQELKSTEKVFTGPFNPASPKAVCEYFAAQGIELRAKGGKFSKDKNTVRKALEKAFKKLGMDYTVEGGVLSLIEDPDPDTFPEVIDNLYKLDQSARAGKGLQAWFDDRYIGEDDFAHPRFIPTGTSLGRLASAYPNFQNLPRVSFGAMVRRVLIPRHPSFGMLKADYSSLEFRVCLWYAGYDKPISSTVFEDLATASNGMFDAAAARNSWKSRDVSKSVVHASDLLEGLTLLKGSELESPRKKAERDNGALLVFDGKQGSSLWMFRGSYVCFTGGNLAERLFGDRSYENRAKALSIQSVYFREYPMIRTWQQQISEKIENHDFIQTASGRYLELQDTNEKILKLAVAAHAQGGGADYCQEAMLRFDDIDRVIATQTHDELLLDDVPNDWSDKRCYDFMVDLMCQPSEILKGFTCPVAVGRGPNYKDTRKLIG